MNTNDYKALDALMGAEDENILKHIGKPTSSMNGVLIYKRASGTLTFVVRARQTPDGLKNLVSGLVLFSEAGEVLHVRGIRLLDTETVSRAQEASSFKEKFEILGEPAADIGSGQTVLAYFTEEATLLILRESGGGRAKSKTVKLVGDDSEI